MEQLLTEMETRGGHFSKFYFDSSARFMVKTIEHFTGNICMYTKFWPGEDFCVAQSGEIADLAMPLATKSKYSPLKGK